MQNAPHLWVRGTRIPQFLEAQEIGLLQLGASGALYAPIDVLNAIFLLT